MDIWKIVGYRKVDFEDAQGKRVSGYNLYLAREPENKAIKGLEVQKLFYSDQYVDFVPSENQMIQILYNRYGKVGSIQAI